MTSKWRQVVRDLFSEGGSYTFRQIKISLNGLPRQDRPSNRELRDFLANNFVRSLDGKVWRAPSRQAHDGSNNLVIKSHEVYE